MNSGCKQTGKTRHAQISLFSPLEIRLIPIHRETGRSGCWQNFVYPTSCSKKFPRSRSIITLVPSKRQRSTSKCYRVAKSPLGILAENAQECLNCKGRRENEGGKRACRSRLHKEAFVLTVLTLEVESLWNLGFQPLPARVMFAAKFPSSRMNFFASKSDWKEENW